jgi:hypothetical protein
MPTPVPASTLGVSSERSTIGINLVSVKLQDISRSWFGVILPLLVVDELHVQERTVSDPPSTMIIYTVDWQSAETPGWYVVCEYFPAGNIEGDNNQYFIDNVKKQVKGKASDTLESGVTSGGRKHGDGMWFVGILFFAALTSIGIVF